MRNEAAECYGNDVMQQSRNHLPELKWSNDD